VPWLAALDRTRSVAGALGSALVMSVAFALGVFPWFATAMSGYTGAPHALGFAALVVLAPVLEPQLFVFAAARHLAGPAPARRAAAGACAWIAAEWALPKLFGDSLGHGLHASPWLRQAADLAGVAGLSLAVLVVNECVLAAIRALRAPPRRPAGVLRPAALAAALVAALAGYGLVRLRGLDAAERGATPIRVALVQAGIAETARLRERLGSYEAVRFILDRHLGLSVEAFARGPVDLLAWPETVYPTTFGTPRSEAGAELDREIETFVAATGVPLVFGSYDGSGGVEYNAGFFLSPDGEGPPAASVYRKAALFPLTERVPAWLDSPSLRAWLPWLGTWRAGSGPRVVPLALAGGRSVRAAPLICYDAVDPRMARAAARAGAELIVTLSNDAWFATGQGPRLHLVVSAFRSLETRLPQIRVTNTGITAVIDASGEVRGELGVGEEGVLVAAVPLGSGTAPGPVVRRGEWLAPAAGIAALAAWLAQRVKEGMRPTGR
jgi:apolipoprotein N-acyltransferase